MYENKISINLVKVVNFDAIALLLAFHRVVLFKCTFLRVVEKSQCAIAGQLFQIIVAVVMFLRPKRWISL